MRAHTNLVAILAATFTTFAQAEHIEEVVVRGSHEKRTIEVAEALVISPDAAQLLRKAPGASVNNNGPLSGIPQYRGMFGPRIGVQLDGTQLAPAGPNWMDPPLSYAAAAQLESLQVYRGIAPVSVVQESIGGAINAVTAQRDFGDSQEPEISGHLLGTAQSVNQGAQVGATVFAVNDSHRLRFAAMTEQGDDAEFPGGELLPSEYTRDRYDASYGFRHGAHTVELSLAHSKTGDTGTPALPMDIASISGDLYSAGYTWLSDSWLIKARIFGSELDHSMTNYHLRNAPPTASLWRRNITDSSNRGYKLSAQLQDDKGSWLFGTDGLLSQHNSDIDNPKNPMFFVTNFNDAKHEVIGLFAERQHTLGGGMSAEFGLRYNRVSSDADEVDGTPAILMPPAAVLRDNFNSSDRSVTDDNFDAVVKLWLASSDEVNWYLGLAQKTRSPSYQERYLWLPLQATAGLADGNTYTGKIDLRPEMAREIEFGLDFDSEGLHFSPRVFYRKVKDYIQGTPSRVAPALMLVNMSNSSNGTQSPAPLQFNNVDANLWGFDMDWRASLSESLALRGLVNYVRGERDDIHDDLYRIMPLNLTVGLDYFGNNWGAALEATWYAEQDRVSETNGEQSSDAYTVANLTAWRQVTQQLRLALGIENLFDEKYEDHLAGLNRVAGNPDLVLGEKLPGYGINGFLRVDYTF